MQNMVDTLYLIAGSRGEYPLADLAAAAAWTSIGTHAIYVVDARPKLYRLPPLTLKGPCLRIVEPSTALPLKPAIFQTMRALAAAIEGGLVFRQAIILCDTSMIVGPGLDAFVGDALERSGALLLGVKDSRDFQCLWRQALGLFYDWQFPHEAWEHAPTTLTDVILCLSYAGATRLHSRGGCEAAKWAVWPGGFGTYLSWLIQLLDGNVVCWGSTEKTLPPLYVCEPPSPPPHVLSSEFLAYGPVTGVRGYAERDLRELYKRHRGELAEEVAAYGPVIAGRLVTKQATDPEVVLA